MFASSSANVSNGQINVAKSMSFSFAFRIVRTTWLLWFPCETSRTVVTGQNIACSGPTSSECPHTAVDNSMLLVSKEFEPPIAK